MEKKDKHVWNILVQIVCCNLIFIARNVLATTVRAMMAGATRMTVKMAAKTAAMTAATMTPNGNEDEDNEAGNSKNNDNTNINNRGG